MTANQVADIHGRGLRSAQPTPTSGTQAGIEYFVTDEGVRERWSGTAWQDITTSGAVAEILDIPTAETDASLVLAPDGAGGVEFRAEAGGSSTWSADTAPASPNGADDEFTATDTTDPIAGWTTLQTPTVIDRNSTFPNHLYIKKTATTASTGHVGVYKAWTPSNGDTITCKVADYVVSVDSYIRGCQLFVAEASPGKMMVLQPVQDSSGPHLAVNYYTAPGTYSSSPASLGAAWTLMGGPLYLRIRYNSSTSIDYFFSTSGLLWSPILRAHNPGFTVGAFGIGIEPANTVTDGEAAFKFVRKNWTPGT